MPIDSTHSNKDHANVVFVAVLRGWKVTRGMKASRFLANAPLQPLNQANKLNELLIAELHSLLLIECEQVAGITFDQVYSRMHSCSSVCQAFCTLYDKLLLDVSVLYFPFCVHPFNIPHDELVRLFFEDSKSPLQMDTHFDQKLINLSTNEFNKFALVASGGTFDHLHCGHKMPTRHGLNALQPTLNHWNNRCKPTGNKALSRPKYSTFEQRKEHVEAFVTLFKGNDHGVQCEVVKLLDA